VGRTVGKDLDVLADPLVEPGEDHPVRRLEGLDPRKAHIWRLPILALGPDLDSARAAVPEAAAIPGWLAEREAALGDVVPGAEKAVRWAGEPGEVNRDIPR